MMPGCIRSGERRAFGGDCLPLLNRYMSFMKAAV
jgi:hypothetical protein